MSHRSFTFYHFLSAASMALLVQTAFLGHAKASIQSIDLNDFSFIAGDPVVIAGDGSSAAIGENPAFFSISLFNDPFFGDPEVVIGGPGVELKFQFDFSEPAGNIDEFFVFVFDTDTGFSLGPSFEFFADSTSSGTVTFDLSSLTPSSPVLGMEFSLNSIFGDGGFDSEVTVSDLRLETPDAVIPEPASIFVWSLLGLTAGGISYRRNSKV